MKAQNDEGNVGRPSSCNAFAIVTLSSCMIFYCMYFFLLVSAGAIDCVKRFDRFRSELLCGRSSEILNFTHSFTHSECEIPKIPKTRQTLIDCRHIDCMQTKSPLDIPRYVMFYVVFG